MLLGKGGVLGVRLSFCAHQIDFILPHGAVAAAAAAAALAATQYEPIQSILSTNPSKCFADVCDDNDDDEKPDDRVELRNKIYGETFSAPSVCVLSSSSLSV